MWSRSAIEKGWKVELSGRKAETEQGIWMSCETITLAIACKSRLPGHLYSYLWNIGKQKLAQHVIKISKIEWDRKITLVLGSQSSKGPLASQLCIIYQDLFDGHQSELLGTLRNTEDHSIMFEHMEKEPFEIWCWWWVGRGFEIFGKIQEHIETLGSR